MRSIVFLLVLTIGIVSVVSDDGFHRISVNDLELTNAVQWLFYKTKFGYKYNFLNINKAYLKKIGKTKIYKVKLLVEEFSLEEEEEVLLPWTGGYSRYICKVRITSKKGTYSYTSPICKVVKVN